MIEIIIPPIIPNVEPTPPGCLIVGVAVGISVGVAVGATVAVGTAVTDTPPLMLTLCVHALLIALPLSVNVTVEEKFPPVV